MSTSKSRFGQVALLLLASLVSAPASAWATSIAIRTGVDAGGAVLANATVDPSWTISVQGGAFAAALVAPAADLCCGMETVGAQAKWITDPSTVGFSTGWGVGGVNSPPFAVARRTFDLTGFDLSTVSLAGAWRVADFRDGIYLNGTLIDPATADTSGGFACNPCNWQIDQAFGVAVGSGLFLSGLNTLELRGSSENSIFDGFWLDATVEGRAAGTAPVPEPASLLLLGTGLAVGARRWRNRKSIA
jgi:PEP-CTERM motif